MKSWLPLALLVFVGGCTMGPDYVRPPTFEPAAFRSAAADTAIVNLPWWEMFEDPVLQDLIDTALAGNRDLRTSMARISEARARLGIVRADLYPRLNYAGSGGVDVSSATDGSNSSGVVALDVSYQLDLWGKVRRSNEAAVQEMLATEEAYRSVTIGLVSQVARTYFLLRDLDNRLNISEQTVTTRQQTLGVVESRQKAGMVTEVDVNQAEIQVYEAEVSVQTFARLRAQTENALSVLLGQPPMDIKRGVRLQEMPDLPEIPVGMPSRLLDRRPDVLAAERRLHAQTARIGVAEALKFPQLNLTADLGAQFSDATTSFAGLGAQIFGPLFNSGENQRRVDVEFARTEQLLNTYEQTFLVALREVEDAMIASDTYESELGLRLKQLDSASNAAELSWVRYEGGLTSYLEVLDLQRSLFNSQLKASETMQLRLTSLVQLYQALGGGWVAQQDSVLVQ
ncbi:MAG: multidrug efflux system outer membrane protein [Candidatus Krumholzibacteriia bacterium]|jgi:multidrug efflux system outer membrane protein